MSAFGFSLTLSLCFTFIYGDKSQKIIEQVFSIKKERKSYGQMRNISFFPLRFFRKNVFGLVLDTPNSFYAWNEKWPLKELKAKWPNSGSMRIFRIAHKNQFQQILIIEVSSILVITIKYWLRLALVLSATC